MSGDRGYLALADNTLQTVKTAGARGPQLHLLQQGQEIDFLAVEAFGHPLLIGVFKHVFYTESGIAEPVRSRLPRKIMAEGPGVTPGYEGLEPKRSCSDPPSASNATTVDYIHYRIAFELYHSSNAFHSFLWGRREVISFGHIPVPLMITSRARSGRRP